MALTFVRLKLRILANGLRGNPARILLFLVSGVAGLGCAIGAFSFLAGQRSAAGLALPLVGAAVVLGWVLLPLVFFGVDESLDPARFALLPLSRRTLITGMLTASLAGVPMLATLIATGGMVPAAGALGGPAAALTELVGVVLGWLLCAASSRAVTSAFATALRSRRSRDVATVLLVATAALAGPLESLASAAVRQVDWARLTPLAGVLEWTPLGAPYTIGLDVAGGRLWAVPVKLLIVLAAIGLLLSWWSVTVEQAMLGVATVGKPRRRRGTPVGQLVFRWLPRTRFGALTARELRYWSRENRRRAGLITFTAMGVSLPVMLMIGGAGNAVGLTGPFVGAIAAVGLANQFGFEGTAYAVNIVADVPGRTELASRVAAYALLVVPLMAAISTVMGFIGDQPAQIPGRFGMVCAAFGTGLLVVLPVSVRGAYALPDTTNPFAASSGAGCTKSLVTFLAMMITAFGVLPLILIGTYAAVLWQWIGLPVGLLWGAGTACLGCLVAGRMLERRMPELLVAVTPRR